jgi:hypothetical protein
LAIALSLARMRSVDRNIMLDGRIGTSQ